jgi:hypothetical protein
MPKFYCQYCGTYAISIQSLTARRCVRHPLGVNKGNCALYEGSEKSEYFCKFCGCRAPSIQSLTARRCTRHPLGVNKGNCAPAL